MTADGAQSATIVLIPPTAMLRAVNLVLARTSACTVPLVALVIFFTTKWVAVVRKAAFTIAANNPAAPTAVTKKTLAWNARVLKLPPLKHRLLAQLPQ